MSYIICFMHGATNINISRQKRRHVASFRLHKHWRWIPVVYFTTHFRKVLSAQNKKRFHALGKNKTNKAYIFVAKNQLPKACAFTPTRFVLFGSCFNAVEPWILLHDVATEFQQRTICLCQWFTKMRTYLSKASPVERMDIASFSPVFLSENGVVCWGLSLLRQEKLEY